MVTITLVAIACHLVSNMALCEEVIVPTDQQAVGRAQPEALCQYKTSKQSDESDKQGCLVYGNGEAYEPITLPPMSYARCSSGDGLKAAADFLLKDPQHGFGWYLKDVKCVPGKYAPRQRA